MKKYILLVVTILSCCAAMSYAQQKSKYLRILERDRDKPSFSHIDPDIADINSELEIVLFKDSLYQRLIQTGAYKVPERLARALTVLDSVLQQQSRLLDSVQAALRSYATIDSAKAAAFNRNIGNFAVSAIRILFMDPIIYAYFEKYPASKGIYNNVVSAIEKRLQELKDSIVNQNATSSTTLQLGGWLHTKSERTPVHLEGFDRNPNQGFYEVNRWRFVPTDEQIAQYQQMKATAAANKNKGLVVFQDLAATMANTIVKKCDLLRKEANEGLTQLSENIQTTIRTTGLDSAAKKMYVDVTDISDLAGTLVTKYQSFSSNYRGDRADEMIMDITNDANTLSNALSNLKRTLTYIIDKLKPAAAGAATEVKAYIGLLEKKISLFSFQPALEPLRQAAANIKLDETALEYTDKVLSLSLKDLPESTRLDLRNTGQREPGDVIILQLRTYDIQSQKAEPLDTRTVTMYEVLPHIYGLPSIVFAQPFDNSNLTGKFQMQPSYSFLVKGVWPWTTKYYRKSRLRNVLTDFSYGLHIGAPDFDKDDVPELGIGFVLSGIHDYLQLGIANNVFKGGWYWFFGIRLPVPFLSIAGSGSAKASIN